ncbi:MAG: SPOR domain-containing protein, partial [Candidatus Rokuibacteriota bacterium]
MKYRHVWPGVLLLAALALLLVGLLRWGDHFLSPGPTGGIHRLLQLWAASRPAEESIAPPAAAAPSSAMDAPANPPAAAAPSVIVPVTPEPSGPAAPPPVATTPVAPVPAPVVKTPPPERAEESREIAAAPTTPPPVRYALALGTFPLSEDAERVEAKLNQAGFSTVRFRLQTPAKLFAVQVSSLKDPEEGQATVERLQKEGHPPSVLLVGRTGVTVRVGPPLPLRTAVQLAEKLRAGGYDARVATEPTRAGQVSLRHGNFASRPEAE